MKALIFLSLLVHVIIYAQSNRSPTRKNSVFGQAPTNMRLEKISKVKYYYEGEKKKEENSKNPQPDDDAIVKRAEGERHEDNHFVYVPRTTQVDTEEGLRHAPHRYGIFFNIDSFVLAWFFASVTLLVGTAMVLVFWKCKKSGKDLGDDFIAMENLELSAHGSRPIIIRQHKKVEGV